MFLQNDRDLVAKVLAPPRTWLIASVGVFLSWSHGTAHGLPIPTVSPRPEIELGATGQPIEAWALPAWPELGETVSNLDAESDFTLDIDSQILEESPVLQRWLETVPDIQADIRRDPAFRTRLRLGYVGFPDEDGTGGILIGIQDLFIGQTPLALSAEYAVGDGGDRESIGVDAQYYLLPLGGYVNIAPVVGYRAVEIDGVTSDGAHLGLRAIVVPSRTGAADLSFAQTWVAPGSEQEVGLTTFSFGYAVTHNLRVATDIQLQKGPAGRGSRVGLLLEWMP